MGELGSIFEGEGDGEGDKPRGPDLNVKVEVPRDALGRDGGFLAPVPLDLEYAGEKARRHTEPGGEAGVRLFLPAQFKTGATLRLRRQGGVHADGVPGDLFVKIEIVEPPPKPFPWGLVVVAVALAAGLVVAMLYAID